MISLAGIYDWMRCRLGALESSSMCDISIVTGTYNRLASLKRFVTSVRQSVGDFSYEIVLVDGGSTDGTIKWCKEQSDVVLIEQGSLLGAVKAFNAGAVAARGRYVILANDDIAFVDESILRAFAFMERYRSVGIGCFYQNRNGQDWHVERMPVVSPTGVQGSGWYGQVCIVPKWLGDKVGWWGDYLHTYGGDNEMSCNVLEAGYHVAPIECACIADYEVQDNLRQLNGGDPRKVKGMHPDSKKWRDKWTRDDKVGPVITKTRRWDSPIKPKMRIMYLPLFEPGNTIQKRTKVGLRKALENRGAVLQHDYMEEGLDMMFDRAAAYNPDMIIFQIQNVNPFYPGTIKELRKEHPDAVLVNWNGDYHPENLFDQTYIEMMKQFDLVGHVTTQVDEEYRRAGINNFYWQIGYEKSDAKPLLETPEFDVVFLGNNYSPTRLALGQFLVNLREEGIKVGLFGSWPKNWANGNNLYDFDEGQRIMRKSKLIISTQQYPDGIGFVSNRLFQALASGGGMVLQQEFKGVHDLLGFKNNRHLVLWESLDELYECISTYLNNDRAREKIAMAGTEFTLDNHSFDRRVEELFQELESRGYTWHVTQ